VPGLLGQSFLDMWFLPSWLVVFLFLLGIEGYGMELCLCLRKVMVKLTHLYLTDVTSHEYPP
jgi:hypothetical protein